MNEQQEVWDGHPRWALTLDELCSLYDCAPHWSGAALGPPVPFGGGVRAMFTVDAIFKPTREDAEAVMWWQVEQQCEAQKMVYVPEDWCITRLVLVNGS